MSTPKSKSTEAQEAGRRGPNMADVAKLAGVSPMTVSRVINGKATVRAGTRSKVAAAAAALNYAPNPEARILAGSRPIRIGFLYSMPSVRSGAYLTEVLLGLLNKVSLNHVQLLVENCGDGASMVEQVGRMIDNGMDGIVLPPPLGDNAAIIKRLVDAGIPVAVIACSRPDPRVSAIGIDDHLAAYRMTRHLIDLGHDRIGFITGHPHQSSSATRLAGYRLAIEECGADPAPELVTQGMFNYRSGLDAAELLLALPDRPSAIFASNDDMAAATVAVAQRLGLDVPGDITVVGFDDTALSTTIWPALSTVRQPTTEMAEAAVESIVQRVTALRGGEDAGPEHTIVDFTLVRRQSDAAPRVRPPMRVLADTGDALLPPVSGETN